jgi:RNA polymerase sigma factor (sigma-70 family)
MVVDMDDSQLLRTYAAEQSEDAFRALVDRYVHLVYSTALRKTASHALAEEVTQAVFILLSRKVDTLRSETILSGWLYRATCFAANDALKAEARRRRREQESFEQMQTNSPETAWEDIAPILDDAMSTLPAQDRQALVLRFFENQNLREVGAALGISDDTAQKRITRALEKLRLCLGKRSKVSAHAVQAAPAQITASVSQSVFAATVPASTQAIVSATAKAFALGKIKVPVAVALMLLAGAGAAFLTVSRTPPPAPPRRISIATTIPAPTPGGGMRLQLSGRATSFSGAFISNGKTNRFSGTVPAELPFDADSGVFQFEGAGPFQFQILKGVTPVGLGSSTSNMTVTAEVRSNGSTSIQSSSKGRSK